MSANWRHWANSAIGANDVHCHERQLAKYHQLMVLAPTPTIVRDILLFYLSPCDVIITHNRIVIPLATDLVRRGPATIPRIGINLQLAVLVPIGTLAVFSPRKWSGTYIRCDVVCLSNDAGRFLKI